METETGTFNKMEIVEIWVVLPQMPTKWGWTHYWWFNQIDSDFFSVLERSSAIINRVSKMFKVHKIYKGLDQFNQNYDFFCQAVFFQVL